MLDKLYEFKKQLDELIGANDERIRELERELDERRNGKQ